MRVSKSVHLVDLEAVDELRLTLKSLQVRSVLLVSPNFYQMQYWRSLFCYSDIFLCDINFWDLQRPFPCAFHPIPDNEELEENLKLFDLVIAQNVFMYVKDPFSAIQNVRLVTHHLMIQEPSYRIRSSSSTGLGIDGDVNRFDMNSQQHRGHILSIKQLFLGEVIKILKEYKGGLNHFHDIFDPPRHLIALVSFSEGLANIEMCKKLGLRGVSFILIFKLYLKRLGQVFIFVHQRLSNKYNLSKQTQSRNKRNIL